MRIGVDAMGGDFAPAAVVEGVLLAKEWIDTNTRVVLYGHRDALAAEFDRLGGKIDDFEVVHCTEVIDMHDHPVKAFST